MPMKKLSVLLMLCLMLSFAALAEADEPSSADRFLSNLSDTWDSFLDMAGDAGKDALDWAEGRVKDLSAWARENGLTDWAQGALEKIAAWADESGAAEWAEERAREIGAAFRLVSQAGTGTRVEVPPLE